VGETRSGKRYTTAIAHTEWTSGTKNGRLDGVTVVVMTMMAVTDPGSERGTCEYHQ
jgi:hypothetical protein